MRADAASAQGNRRVGMWRCGRGDLVGTLSRAGAEPSRARRLDRQFRHPLGGRVETWMRASNRMMRPRRREMLYSVSVVGPADQRRVHSTSRRPDAAASGRYRLQIQVGVGANSSLRVFRGRSIFRGNGGGSTMIVRPHRASSITPLTNANKNSLVYILCLYLDCACATIDFIRQQWNQ